MNHHTRSDFAYARIPEALLYDPSVTLAAKAVYAVLDRHGSDPASCFPSHRRIADVLGMKPASVARPLKELEEAGWIEREARFDEKGGRTTDGYHVLVERVLERAHPTQEQGGPRVPEREDASLLEREPLEREGAKAPRGAALERAGATFDDFWQAYPRKTDKGGARKAWAKALTKTDSLTIVAGARRYAADPNLPEGRFRPHASTWLNGERWTDGPLPSRDDGRPKSRMQRTLANLAPLLEEESDEHPRNGNGAGALGRGVPEGGRA